MAGSAGKKAPIRGAADPEGASAAAEEAMPAAAAEAEAEGRAMVPSPVAIDIHGLRDAHLLSFLLAPGARVKVASVAPPHAAPLSLLLGQQMVRSGWVVANEDLRALNDLALSYHFLTVAIEGHHDLVSLRIHRFDLGEKSGYLQSFMEWSRDFETVAARVPSIDRVSSAGVFKFSVLAKNVCKIVRKVVVGGFNGRRRTRRWLDNKLAEIRERLVKLSHDKMFFPLDLQKQKQQQRKAELREASKRRKKDAADKAKKKKDAGGEYDDAISPGEYDKALVPSDVMMGIWGLRSAHIHSVKLAKGSRLKFRSVETFHALSLELLIRQMKLDNGWVLPEEEDDMERLTDLGASDLLPTTGIVAHLDVVSSYIHLSLGDRVGCLLAFRDWAREFQERARRLPFSVVSGLEFSFEAESICSKVREVVVAGLKSNRSIDWLDEKLDEIGNSMKKLKNSIVALPKSGEEE